MEKRLCFCKSCNSFYIINSDKNCPKCGGFLVSSVVTESEWNRSSNEQKNAFKRSLSEMANPGGSGYTGQRQSTEGRGNANQGSTGTYSGGYNSGGYNSSGYNNSGYNNNGSDNSGYSNSGYNSNGNTNRRPFNRNGFGGRNNNGSYSNGGYSGEVEKRRKTYKTWSIVIGVIGIVSFFSLIGQYAQLEAQGYVITDKTGLYLGCAFSVFCAFAGFFGMGVYKQPSKLNTSWVLYIIAFAGMILLSVVYKMIPGWLCVIACGFNIYNGSKLKKSS